MNRNMLTLRLTCTLAVLAGILQTDLLDAAPLQVGEADLVPSVQIGYYSTSNAFRSSTNQLESTGVIVSPSARIIAERRGLELEFGYEGRFGSYSVDELNFDDHELYFNANALLGARKRAEFRAFLAQGHDDLGEGTTRGVAGIGDEQVRHVSAGIEGSYTFGAKTARLNVTGGLLLETFDYQNRSDILLGRDFSEISPYGEVSFRLSADTRATTEIRLRSVNSDSGLYDRIELQGLVGLRFRNTGKSGGAFKVGVSNASYDDSGVADRSFLTASAQLYILPTSFSRFDLNVSRKLSDIEEVNRDADTGQSINDLASIRWTHNWSGFVRTETLLSLNNDNRDCPELGSKSTVAQFDVFYDVLSWMEIGVGLSQTNRSGDDCTGNVATIDLDYDRQDARIFVNLSL